MRTVAFLLVVLQALPLIWRRRWPVAVFVAVGIPRTIYDQLAWSFDPLPLASAIAYYTVMDRCPTRVRSCRSRSRRGGTQSAGETWRTRRRWGRERRRLMRLLLVIIEGQLYLVGIIAIFVAELAFLLWGLWSRRPILGLT